jgi:hypothetical protein
MLSIAQYFWRLLPANPILLRVVQMNGKRRRDLFIRCGYLGLLVVIVMFFLNSDNSSLTGLAKASANLFQGLSYCQLALVALLAPIFTAGAITAERDSQTYDILLSTPLSNGQIVLGSLFSRLFFVIALLISGVPIFSITDDFQLLSIHRPLYGRHLHARPIELCQNRHIRPGSKQTGSIDNELANRTQSVSGVANDFPRQGLHPAWIWRTADGTATLAARLVSEQPGELLRDLHVRHQLCADFAIRIAIASARPIDDHIQNDHPAAPAHFARRSHAKATHGLE